MSIRNRPSRRPSRVPRRSLLRSRRRTRRAGPHTRVLSPVSVRDKRRSLQVEPLSGPQSSSQVISYPLGRRYCFVLLGAQQEYKTGQPARPPTGAFIPLRFAGAVPALLPWTSDVRARPDLRQISTGPRNKTRAARVWLSVNSSSASESPTRSHALGNTSALHRVRALAL